MSFTHEQKELLRAVAQVYASGDHGSFTFIKTIDEVDTGRLMYGRHANVIVHNVDESDFIHLEREGLLTLRHSGGDLAGKPTSKGINVAMRWIPADQRTQPPPSLDTPRSSLPPRTQPPPSLDTPRSSLPPRTQPPPSLDSSLTPASVQIRPPEDVRKTPTVFIGHGHSKLWLELKDFLRERLKVGCVEFNSASVAGISTQERLSEMLDQASFALLVMTAEDDHGEGRKHARENVVHEAGLFQGRLGFRRAVLLVEDGCQTPSNILGLTHIPFPKDHIDAAFEKVRAALEREGVV